MTPVKYSDIYPAEDFEALLRVAKAMKAVVEQYKQQHDRLTKALSAVEHLLAGSDED